LESASVLYPEDPGQALPRPLSFPLRAYTEPYTQRSWATDSPKAPPSGSRDSSLLPPPLPSFRPPRWASSSVGINKRLNAHLFPLPISFTAYGAQSLRARRLSFDFFPSVYETVTIFKFTLIEGFLALHPGTAPPDFPRSTPQAGMFCALSCRFAFRVPPTSRQIPPGKSFLGDLEVVLCLVSEFWAAVFSLVFWFFPRTPPSGVFPLDLSGADFWRFCPGLVPRFVCSFCDAFSQTCRMTPFLSRGAARPLLRLSFLLLP